MQKSCVDNFFVTKWGALVGSDQGIWSDQATRQSEVMQGNWLTAVWSTNTLYSGTPMRLRLDGPAGSYGFRVFHMEQSDPSNALPFTQPMEPPCVRGSDERRWPSYWPGHLQKKIRTPMKTDQFSIQIRFDPVKLSHYKIYLYPLARLKL